MTKSTSSQIEAAQDELILELDEVDFVGLKWMYRGLMRGEINYDNHNETVFGADELGAG